MAKVRTRSIFDRAGSLSSDTSTFVTPGVLVLGGRTRVKSMDSDISDMYSSGTVWFNLFF